MVASRNGQFRRVLLTALAVVVCVATFPTSSFAQCRPGYYCGPRTNYYLPRPRPGFLQTAPPFRSYLRPYQPPVATTSPFNMAPLGGQIITRGGRYIVGNQLIENGYVLGTIVRGGPTGVLLCGVFCYPQPAY